MHMSHNELIIERARVTLTSIWSSSIVTSLVYAWLTNNLSVDESKSSRSKRSSLYLVNFVKKYSETLLNINLCAFISTLSLLTNVTSHITLFLCKNQHISSFSKGRLHRKQQRKLCYVRNMFKTFKTEHFRHFWEYSSILSECNKSWNVIFKSSLRSKVFEVSLEIFIMKESWALHEMFFLRARVSN